MLDVNEHFDGCVKSIAFETVSLPATVGLLQPGKHVLNTSDREQVAVSGGVMNIEPAGEAGKRRVSADKSFEVLSNSAFEFGVESETAYLCLDV